MLRWCGTFLLLASSLAAQDELRIRRKPTAAQEIFALCTQPGTPKAEALSRLYLARQWDRLTGAVKASPDQDLTTAALSEDEQRKLRSWFEAEPEARRQLLLALDPFRDDVRAGARVALKLRELYPRETGRFPRLVAAFACVWDRPAAAQGETVRTPQPMAWEETFGWLVKHEPHFAPHFREMPFPLLAFVAADRLSLPERDWAQQKYNYRSELGTLFHVPPYDYDKLKGLESRLEKAQAEYTLPNLFKFGGVCDDQAYFAVAVCRAQGMPAFHLSAYGSAGVEHAWAGWIDRDAQGWLFKETGRYKDGRYREATAWNPRTGAAVRDYMLALDARALSDEQAFLHAEVLHLIGKEFGANLPVAAKTRLLQAALAENPLHRETWLAVAQALGDGELSKETAVSLWELALKELAEFPDLAYEILQRFQKAYPALSEQHRILTGAIEHFLAAQRPDLSGRLRINQVILLASEGQKSSAAEAALAGLQESAGEGELGAELAQRLVELLRELNRLPAAIEPLKSAAGKMPIVRAYQISPYWIQVMELVRDIAKEIGDTQTSHEAERRILSQTRNLSGYFPKP